MLKILLRKWKHNSQHKYLEHIYVTRNSYPEYIKNPYDSTTKNKNLIQNWAKDLDRHFSKDYVQMTYINIQWWLTS